MYTPMKYMRFMICNERKERHMFNEITIGPLTLHTYGLMIGLGFLAAYAMCYYRGKKMKMEKAEISFMESSGVPSSADWWEPDCFIIL